MSSCHVLSGTDRSHDLSIRGMVSGSSFRKSHLHKAVDKECNRKSDKLFHVKGKLCCLVYYECRTQTQHFDGKTGNFGEQSKMVRAIPFRKLQKIWAVF